MHVSLQQQSWYTLFNTYKEFIYCFYNYDLFEDFNWQINFLPNLFIKKHGKGCGNKSQSKTLGDKSIYFQVCFHMVMVMLLFLQCLSYCYRKNSFCSNFDSFWGVWQWQLQQLSVLLKQRAVAISLLRCPLPLCQPQLLTLV